jgi:mannosyltransferase OCH1-like enzyme
MDVSDGTLIDDITNIDTLPGGIQKLIHLTYKSIEEIPDKWKDVIPAWQKTHPDWKIIFWSDASNEYLINTYFGKYRKLIDSMEYTISKIDIIRILYLYRYGGVYIDMDYIPLKNIGNLIKGNEDIYLFQVNGFNVFANSFMASKPRLQFWLDYVDTIPDSRKFPWYYTKHWKIMYSAGPMHLHKCVDEYEGTIGFIPYKLIQECSICNRDCKLSVDPYLKALDGKSWNSWDSRFLNFIQCNWKDILIVILILLCILIWYIRGRFSTCKQIANACGMNF